jgi:translation initiation factor 3 subunit L
MHCAFVILRFYAFLALSLSLPLRLASDDKESSAEESSVGLLRLVGYFASVGLMRVHFLLGDFASALRALEPLHFRKKVPHPHVHTYIHVHTYMYIPVCLYLHL